MIEQIKHNGLLYAVKRVPDDKPESTKIEVLCGKELMCLRTWKGQFQVVLERLGSDRTIHCAFWTAGYTSMSTTFRRDTDDGCCEQWLLFAYEKLGWNIPVIEPFRHVKGGS